MKVGRPPVYSKVGTRQHVLAYLMLCEDQERIPTIEGLAVYLNVSRETLYAWNETHEEFSYIFEQLKAKQAEMLINKGLAGTFNSTITKLILTKHGYHDKSEQDVTSGGKPLPILPYVRPDDRDAEGPQFQEAD